MSNDTPVSVGLTVCEPFDQYVKGNRITDQAVIAQILNSEYARNVNKFALPLDVPSDKKNSVDGNAVLVPSIKKGE